ncbi:enoyl-CoA hydratase/isomerase family protein [Tropicimonas sp. IMCC6043]|uniref:enoyl-CoA hydratase/isomerase family protein n=1 Tax=Tropicimonas sp. IMCC6043 TaxID=2510645 RepID=UPI00101C56BD|nr:enoyl-CoA hydratase/isomerase family protein [Tropicimonas sp. IMCC6043]RYH11233.1 enoyl-CoA hydratase/isomerase family protein [Tropicimonas sp. IMCC6043]
MSDISIRKAGRTGRITLTRPKALNALTYEMCLAIDAALAEWAADDTVAMLVIDAEGEKAFCAGGDIAEMYATGTSGDFAYGRRFWRDEYRMNARLFEFPKPVASFLQGFTMGGGVGIGCHGSHRVVCESSRIAMPECGIGLIPDVGGSLLLARAPGRLGAYLGTTGTRMGPADALHAGFADHFVPAEAWPDLIADLERTGEATRIGAAATTPPAGGMAALQPEIDRLFAGETLSDILNALRAEDTAFSATTLAALLRNAPLAMACTLEIARRMGKTDGIRAALDLEYRFTWRAMEHGDFLEGIRAAIIDKDRAPRWRHGLAEVTPAMVDAMLRPLGKDALTFDREDTA